VEGVAGVTGVAGEEVVGKCWWGDDDGCNILLLDVLHQQKTWRRCRALLPERHRATRFAHATRALEGAPGAAIWRSGNTAIRRYYKLTVLRFTLQCNSPTISYSGRNLNTHKTNERRPTKLPPLNNSPPPRLDFLLLFLPPLLSPLLPPPLSPLGCTVKPIDVLSINDVRLRSLLPQHSGEISHARLLLMFEQGGGKG
jgi:hypothetical protein